MNEVLFLPTKKCTEKILDYYRFGIGNVILIVVNVYGMAIMTFLSGYLKKEEIVV